MSDNYLLYDPAAFGALEIKEDTREAEILRLRAENEKLRAALKPFADKEYAYERWADTARDAVWLNVSDLRTAAAALKETGDEKL